MAVDYHAFISYSHAADHARAAALQRALQAVGKPWYRRSTIKVFRDKTSLAASPGLWPDIERHLERSRFFVLMASEAAAASPWVRKEIAWWLSRRSVQTLLIVVTAGDLVWDAGSADFDRARSTAIPADLFGAFREEPLYVDLRWAGTHEQTSLRHPRFRDAALTLAAVLHGRPKDELDSEEIRQHRRLRIATGAALVLVGGFAVLAAVAFRDARDQTARAESNWRESQSRRLATLALEHLDGDHDLGAAIQYAVLAWRLSQTAEAANAMHRIVHSTGAVAQLLDRHAEGIRALAFSADSKRLATAGREGSILLWDVERGARSGRVLVPAPASGPRQGRDVDVLAFEPGGGHLLAWSSDGKMNLWDLASAQARHFEAPLGKGDSLYGAAVAAGARQVAVAGDALLAVWTPASGDVARAPVNLQRQRVYGARFDGDGQVVALVGDTQSREHVRLLRWNPANGDLHQGPAAVGAGTFHVFGVEPVFSPDGKHLLMWNDGKPAVWSIAPDLTLRALPPLVDAAAGAHGHGGVAASFDADGQGLWLAAERSHGGAIATSVQWQSWQLAPSPHRVAQGELAGGRPTRSADGRWLAAITLGGGAVSDLQRPHAPASAVAPSCDPYSDACAISLCEKISTQLDAEKLRSLFGVADYEVFYETYKPLIDASICRVR